MLKYLIITFLIIYLLSRVGGFLFRSIFWMLGMRAMDKQMRNSQQQQQPRRREGDVHVDYNSYKNTNRPNSSSKGGDYIDIDYEEVK